MKSIGKLGLKRDKIFVILDPMVKEHEVIGPAGKPVKLALPPDHSERTRIGTIAEVGPDVQDYRVGDRVLVGTWSGVRLHLVGMVMYGEAVDEDRFRVVREDEILAAVMDENG
jgi:hypothetical protein